MKKVLKWIGIVLAGLLGLLIVAVIIIVVMTTAKRNKNYELDIAAVSIPANEASLARGEHVVRAIAGCDGCHGKDLGGMALLDDPTIMTFSGPNLTTGKGGAGSRFSDEDWVRAIRHGVGEDGKPLLLMPSQNFRFMTDGDLGAVVAYLKSLPPVDNVVPEPRFGPLGYLLGLLEPALVPAALFDHDEPPMKSVEPGVTEEYGGYLVALGTCRDCHGEHLNGRELPAMLNEPPSRNLTPAGELSTWTKEEFIETIRTGITPVGFELREPMAGVLPTLQQQSNEELEAIFLYLQSLPPREFGE